MQELLPREAPEPAEGQDPDALPGLRLTSRFAPERLPLAVSVAICLVSGAALSLALPPADIGPVAFVAMAPFLWLVRRVRARRGALLGLAFGLAYFGALLWWIERFGQMAWSALTIASAVFVAAFGFLAPVIWRDDRPIRSSVGLAALWTVMEFARGAWPLGGFTWGGVAYTQANDRFLLPLASVTGALGVTFVVVLVNTLLVVAVERGRGRPITALAAVGLAIAVAFAPALIVVPAANGRPVRVATVQVDVRQAASSDPVQEDLGVAKQNIDGYRKLVSDPPQLGVWGESALDPGATAYPAVRSAVSDVVREVGAPALIGAVTTSPDGTSRNETLLYDARGHIVDRYAKTHLVPFGEYVPWRNELSWISALQQVPLDLTPGTDLHTMSVEGFTFGSVICFENSFASIDRQLVANGAEFLVVSTNNASYGISAASAQHLIMSRFRAVENARWVVHAAVSGISAYVDPDGGVHGETGLFQTTTTHETITSSTARTVYTRFGNWFPWLSVVVAAGLVLVPRRREREQPAPPPLPGRARALVVLPTLEEHDTIGAVMDRLLALPEGVDLLVIDDASPDGTAVIAKERLATGRVEVLDRPGKMGLASAYLTGFRHAAERRYDLVVEMDSDLSHRPEELPELLAGAAGADLVIGSRYIAGGSVTNWSRSRVLLSKAGNAYARISLGFPLHDATSGFRVYRRRLIQHILENPPTAEGYGFQIELALRAWQDGFAVAERPISFREREHGHSKLSRRIVAEALWLVAAWGVKARLGRRNALRSAPHANPP
ncbi:MAG: apolipoprotein N-acyltransferase [Actinomycetota bacterium]